MKEKLKKVAKIGVPASVGLGTVITILIMYVNSKSEALNLRIDDKDKSVREYVDEKDKSIQTTLDKISETLIIIDRRVYQIHKKTTKGE